MKKLFVFFSILGMIYIGIPKVANAAQGCETKIVCDNYVVVCDFKDYVTWQEIYCGGSVLD